MIYAVVILALANVLCMVYYTVKYNELLKGVDEYMKKSNETVSELAKATSDFATSTREVFKKQGLINNAQVDFNNKVVKILEKHGRREAVSKREEEA